MDSTSMTIPTTVNSVFQNRLALLSPSPSATECSQRNRADTFPIAEIELMLKEMKNRSDVILSLSPSSHRLKKSAWEEVTAIMGIYFPKRNAEQVKKKWENLLTKTRRKVRQGLINTSSWTKLNELVWNFLLENRETKYLFGPGRFSRAEELSNLLGYEVTSSSMSSNLPKESWSIMQPINHATVNNDNKFINKIQNKYQTESNISYDFQKTEPTLNNKCLGDCQSILEQTDPAKLFPHLSEWSQLNKSTKDELLNMWRHEHSLRMKILTLQHQAALVQHELLKVQLEKSNQNI